MLATIPLSVEKKIVRDQRNLLRMISSRHIKIAELSGLPDNLTNRLALTVAYAELAVLQEAICEVNHEVIEEFETLARGTTTVEELTDEEEVA